jgi:hypothetical protein
MRVKLLGKAIRDLARAGAVDPGFVFSVRSAFIDAQDEVCSSIGSDLDTDLPDPSPTSEQPPTYQPTPLAEKAPAADPTPPACPTSPAEPTPSDTPACSGGESGGYYNPYYPSYGGWRRYLRMGYLL